MQAMIRLSVFFAYLQANIRHLSTKLPFNFELTMAQLLKIYPENPAPRHILQAVECLRNGGIIIYPTDTVYGIGCDITNAKACERIANLRGIKIEKANFSFVCHDLSHIADFTLPVDTYVFRLMKAALPGPFTFILPANGNVPKLFKNKKKTVGIRIPDNNIARAIVLELGNPILSASTHPEDQLNEYAADPELLWEQYKDKVDMVIDGGAGGLIPSTVVDCSGDEPVVLRQGKGDLEAILNA